MIIQTTDGSPLPDSRALAQAVESVFGPASAQIVEKVTSSSEFDVKISPVSEPTFTLVMLPGFDGLSLDGLPDQNVRVAAAIRGTMSREYARTILLDVDAYQYVDLAWGITAEGIKSSWRSIDEGGFENL